jgi:hypothetical protein
MRNTSYTPHFRFDTHLGQGYFWIFQYFIDITESFNMYKAEMMLEEEDY